MCPLPIRPLALALAAGGVLGAASCSSMPDRNGQVALGRRDGHTLVYLHTCRGGVRDVSISADREGLAPEQTNPVLGELQASSPVSGDVTIDLAAPGPQWRVTTPIALPTGADKGVIVTGADADANTEMQQSYATIGQVNGLSPTQVVVGSGQVTDLAQFRSGACASG